MIGRKDAAAALLLVAVAMFLLPVFTGAPWWVSLFGTLPAAFVYSVLRD